LRSSPSTRAASVPPSWSWPCRPTDRSARAGCCGSRSGSNATAPGTSRWRRRSPRERTSMSEPASPMSSNDPDLPKGSPGGSSTPEGTGPRTPRRRGSRGGRGRSRRPAGVEATEGAPSEAPAPTTAAPRPRIGDSRPGPAASTPSGASADRDGSGDGGRRRRRRGGRSRGGRAGESRQPAAERASVIDPELLERRRGRERKGRPVGRYLMCVQVRPEATQIAVLEGRSLLEHYVSRPQDDVTEIHGNIYIGRVQNVLPGMEAAFVDISTPKNAVLYRGDVTFDADEVERPTGGGQARIEQLLRARQMIVCQVTKNPIGAKGARLTQE